MATEATKLEILNSALRMVGSFHIDADDETSSTYEITTRAFSQAVTEVFGDNIFNYNTKCTTLTGSVSTELPNYDYEFTFPSDFNIFLFAENDDGYIASNYRFANGKLYCSEESLKLTYTYIPDLETSASGLPAFLTRLLTLHMAQNMAIELSGSENRHEILFKQYTLALRRARTLEGRQGPAQQYINDGNSQFISAHQTYGKV
tara:strand:- start:14354 stop:14965 length:612 start_codon:yes stop_codon:yes gene_type:complete